MRNWHLVPPGILLLALAAAAAPTDAGSPRRDGAGDPLPAGALARLGTTRFRDGNYINAVALSPDGKAVAVGANQGIRVLDLATGKEVRTLPITGFANFSSVGYSPDGKVLGALDYSGRMQFWNPATGDLVGQVAPPPGPRGGFARVGNAFSLSGDGKYVAIGGDNFGRDAKNHATVYEVATGKQTAQVEVLHNQSARALLSPDGKVLVTAGQYMPFGVPEPPTRRLEVNQTLELWDAATGKELRKVRNEAGWGVANVAFSPDGKHMAVVAQTGGLAIWDVASGKELRRLAGRRNLGAFLAYAPDGKTLAAGGSDGVVQTWDAATGKRLGLHDVPRNPAGRVTFTAGGKLLAWGSNGQSVYVWDVLAEKWLTPTGGHQAGVSAVAFAPGGRGVVSAAIDGSVCYWDAAGKETRRVQLRGDDAVLVPPAAARLGGVVLSPDGKYVLAGTVSGTALFELDKGREVCTFSSGFAGGGVVGAFTPDGSVLATVNPDPQARKPVVRLYDVATGQELRKLEGHAGDLRAVAFAPDGKTLASASTDFQAGQTSDVRLWETATGKSLWRAARPQSYVQGLAFSPDGQVLAVLEPTGGILLYETAGGHELRRLGAGVGAGNSSAMVFSPDGRLLAVAALHINGRKTPVRLYELATGGVRQEFLGHDGPVTALAFSADGQRLASGGSDTTVLLWDVTGRTDGGAAKGKLGAEEADQLWAALRDADARSGFQAMSRLQASPDDAVALLAKQVKPADPKGAETEAITKLIVALDADDYDERQRAAKELAALGQSAEPALRKARASAPSAEAKRAIEDLLDKLKDKAGPAPELLRSLRAVEVLEHVGTPEAKKVLESLARGRAEAPLTEAARGALGRLGRAASP